MTLKISDDRMTLEIVGAAVADATIRADGLWQVSTWPEPLDRNQAITALTVTVLLQQGYPAGHPLVTPREVNSPDLWTQRGCGARLLLSRHHFM